MSRTFFRFLAAAAIAAAMPAVAKAQPASCTFVEPVITNAASCNVSLSASVAVPKLGRLSIDDSTAVFPSPVWATFLANPTATTVVTNVAVTVRSNATHNLTLTSAGWASGAWGLSDVATAYAGTVCTDGTGTAAFTSGTASLITGGGATADDLQYLCLALTYPGDLSDPKLAPGDYVLPLTLTLTAP